MDGTVRAPAWERWKPAAPAWVHLLAAALLWTGVGVGLGTAGAVWTFGAAGGWGWVLLPAALIAGLLKARVALEPTARRSAARIRARGDGRCLGGFLSWRTWLFVAAMMALGAGLRRSPLPRGILGFVYVAVGAALLRGSRVFWAEVLRGTGS